MDAEVVSSLNNTRSGSFKEVGFVCWGGWGGHGKVVVGLRVVCGVCQLLVLRLVEFGIGERRH